MIINPYIFEYNSIEFTTNKNGTFNPAILTSDDTIAIWDVSGETSQYSNEPSFTLDGTDRVVKLKISDASKITSIVCTDQNIKGTIDLLLLTECITFQFGDNTELTVIPNPESSAFVTTYNAFNCNLSSVDLSMFPNIGNTLRIQDNTNLATFTPPNSSVLFVDVRIFSTSVTTLDFSTMNISTRLWIPLNSNLTTVIFPVTSNNFDDIWIYGTAIGVLAWENLTGTIGLIRIYDCNFTASESDETIVKIAALGLSNLTLVMDGTNAALTDGSVTGFDGLQAKSDIESLGGTVTNN